MQRTRRPSGCGVQNVPRREQHWTCRCYRDRCVMLELVVVVV